MGHMLAVVVVVGARPLFHGHVLALVCLVSVSEAFWVQHKRQTVQRLYINVMRLDRLSGLQMLL